MRPPRRRQAAIQHPVVYGAQNGPIQSHMIAAPTGAHRFVLHLDAGRIRVEKSYTREQAIELARLLATFTSEGEAADDGPDFIREKYLRLT